jgi:outer membrane protein assembly factor BamB
MRVMTGRGGRFLLGAAAASAVMGVLVPARATASGLSMTGFSPASGPVGTAVTISGGGFVSGDIVRFNGTSAGKSTANADGTQIVARVPAFATSGPITVTDPSTGQTVGLPGTAFQVTRGVYAAPRKAWPGESLRLAGSALSADRSMPIDLGRVQVGVALTDASGDFQLEVSVPWDTTPGKTSIGVLDPAFGRLRYIIFVVGDWQAFRHDASHSGLDTYETSLAPGNVSTMSTKWSHHTGNADYGLPSPAVADGTVYIGTGQAGQVIAYDASTAHARWTHAMGAEVFSSPTVAEGVVYIGSSDGRVTALNGSTGGVIWSFNTGGTVPTQETTSSPAVANGIVYAGSMGGLVVALQAADGSPLWSHDLGAAVVSSPAVAGGVVYVGAEDGSVYALDASTGATDWSYQTGDKVESSPAVVGGVVYVGSNDGKLYALDASTGSVAWSYVTAGAVESSPAVANGVIFFGSSDRHVYAVNATTGAKVWRFTAEDSVRSSPAVANGVVYVLSDDIGVGHSTVYALSATTGTAQWSYQTAFYGNQTVFTSSPAVSNGGVYVGSGGDTVYAFGR